MPRTLTAKSSLENLRKEAKRWLHAIRAGDQDARERLQRLHPRAPVDPGLRDVQQALACDYDAVNWAALKERLADHELGLKAHDELVAAFLKFACLRYDGDHPSLCRSAARILERHPEVARDNVHVAATCGDLEQVRRILAQRPAAAKQKCGVQGWEPLQYVCYGRLPIPSASDRAVPVAEALLDAGADPNVRFPTEGGYEFSALTGVIGEGEGSRFTQPPHPNAIALATLLIERGADPYDPQGLYNTSLERDEIFWPDFLYERSRARQETNKWVDPSTRWPRSSMLDYLLGNAVDRNHLERARWLLERGANPKSRHYYDKRNLHTKALLIGHGKMADVLRQCGAEVEPLLGHDAFQVACLALDGDQARTLAKGHPEYLSNAGPMVVAAIRNRADIVTLLLDLGMSPDVPEHKEGGLRPLHVAARHDSVEVAEVLVARGAMVDIEDPSYGSTPLGWALYFDKRRVTETLAKVSRSISSLAGMGNIERLREVLAEKGSVTDEESAAFFVLPEDEDRAVELASLLLAHGANANVRSNEGLTPAEHAEKRGFDELADLLRNRRSSP